MTRLLRHARADFGTLRQNPAHNFAARHALVHYASGAIYSFIPKNACTTMRYSLALANGAIAGPEDFVWVHQNNTTFSAELRDLATAPYSFVILRCPYARLASVFLDKIVRSTGEAWALRRFDGDRFELDELTFRQFCRLLKTLRIRNGNIHWRPQCDFLVYDDYDGWFRLEAFAEAAAEITARTGLEVRDARALAGHGTDRYALEDGEGFADWPVLRLAEMQRAGRAPSHAALYDSALAAEVGQLYKADIALYTDRFGPGGLLFP